MNEEHTSSTAPQAEPSGEEEGARLPSLPARIGQTFFSPGALFEALKARPAWIAALVLLVVINFGTNLILPEEVVRAAIEAQAAPDATPEQIDQIVGFTKTFGRALAIVGAPIMIAIVAGILILIFNVFTGGKATYRQLFSATTHAFYIYTLGGILTLALILAGSEPDTRLSLGLLLPGQSEGYLARFLGGVNFFSLWTAAVLGIAVSRIYPGRKAGSAAMPIIALYLVLAAIVAALGGLGAR